jgi:hypothetical protein
MQGIPKNEEKICHVQDLEESSEIIKEGIAVRMRSYMCN